MRPVDRGPWPEQADGSPVQFAEYADAKGHLLEKLGELCSYCEMPISNAPAVEHVQPKIRHGDLERTWCNLLLSCCYCNSTKGKSDPGRGGLLWPDVDNTALAFSYSVAGARVNEGLPGELFERASRTFRLTGLDRRPGGEREPSAADRRFLQRQQVWHLAQMAQDDLERNRCATVMKWIVSTARARGFWSVWMTVFKDDVEMRARFIQAFEGTAAVCFDARTCPVRRAGGAL